MEMVHNLKGEYLEIYNEVVDELEAEEVGTSFSAEVKNDILDMFLSAQNDNVPPFELIGKNTKTFVAEIVKDFNKSNSGIFRVCQIIANSMIAVVALSVLDIREGALNIGLETMMWVFIWIISDILGKKLSRSWFKHSTRKISKNMIEIGIFSVGMIPVMVITELLNFPTLITISSPYIFIGACLIMWL